MVYPIKLSPYYRHGSATPWGGTALRTLFSRDIPDDTTGESLEASAIEGMPSVIINGDMAGKTLKQAFDEWGSALTGEGYDEFPLLVKLIDARKTLSVQVHPGNEYAQKTEHKLGKSECWVVLDAKPGARIVCGLKKGTDAIEMRLNWMSVSAGDVIYIPSGLVHAIGEGIVVYELQQSSDVTYRLWDWGSARPLHVKKAMDVIDLGIKPEKARGETVETDAASVTNLINCEYFSLARAEIHGDMPVPSGRMSIITALGDCRVIYPQGEVELHNGETAVIPAAQQNARISGKATVLIGLAPQSALSGGSKA